jgi:hypothetical protein
MTGFAQCGTALAVGTIPDFASLHPGYAPFPIHDVKQRSLLASRRASQRPDCLRYVVEMLYEVNIALIT